MREHGNIEEKKSQILQNFPGQHLYVCTFSHVWKKPLKFHRNTLKIVLELLVTSLKKMSNFHKNPFKLL